MKKSLSLVLLIICGAFFLGCALGSSSDDGELDNSSNKKESELEISETKGYADEYGFAYYIEGKAKNKTDKKFSYVQVKFNVYDEDGNVLGSCLDNQNNVMGNETWKFKAICSGEAKDVKSFKYTGYDAY